MTWTTFLRAASGLQVAICESCAEFAKDVIAHAQEQWE
jgi:hypothetical protein